MMCQVCADKGITAVPWTDAPDDYAVCFCKTGQGMRRDTGGYALWQVWATREHVPLSQVFFLEEILTPAELQERGFEMPAKPTAVAGREAALLAAGKGRKR